MGKLVIGNLVRNINGLPDVSFDLNEVLGSTNTAYLTGSKNFKSYTVGEDGQSVFSNLGWTIAEASSATKVSVAVYVNGTRKFPVTDFTHTTSAVTLLVAAVETDVVYIEQL
jgi:hypothetical protein